MPEKRRDASTAKRTRTGSATAAAAGVGLHLQGLRLLRRERSLWKLALMPLALSLAAVGLAVALVFAHSELLFGLVTAWMPEPSAGAWYEWIWVAPARLLLDFVGVVFFLLVAAAAALAALLLASVLAAPFHDALSRRVEEIVSGSAPEVAGEGLLGLLREGRRASLEELRRLAFFFGIQALLGVIGLAVPGGQLVAAPAMTLVAMLFLPLDYASYALDRRRLTFREKRRWLRDHAAAMLGFGAAAFALCLVPGLNLLAMPVFVVAGTLLALRYPPAPSSSRAS